MIEARDTAVALRRAAEGDELATLCAGLGIELMVLFGSAVHSPDPGDVDVAIAFDVTRQHSFLDAVNALGRAFPGDHLDVMDLDKAGPVARQRALTRGEVLYAAHRSAFSERQLFAIREFMDTQYLRDAQLELMSRG